MADQTTREAVAEVVDRTTVEAKTNDGLWLGDAIRSFLDAKRAGGRSVSMIVEKCRSMIVEKCRSRVAWNLTL